MEINEFCESNSEKATGFDPTGILDSLQLASVLLGMGIMRVEAFFGFFNNKALTRITVLLFNDSMKVLRDKRIGRQYLLLHVHTHQGMIIKNFLSLIFTILIVVTASFCVYVLYI